MIESVVFLGLSGIILFVDEYQIQYVFYIIPEYTIIHSGCHTGHMCTALYPISAGIQTLFRSEITTEN